MDSRDAAIKEALDGQWQPIETAPRDGTCFLLWSEGVSLRPMVARYYKMKLYGATFYSGRDTEVCGTHWMPLPTPPQQKRVTTF